MPLELEDQPRVVFDRNPLKLVVAEVRFPAVYALEQASGVAQLQEAVRDDFPIALDELGALERPTGRTTRSYPRAPGAGWRFQDLEARWTLVVTQQSLAIECHNYRRYEEFRERVSSVLATAASLIWIPRRTRFGVRYSDEITHPKARLVTDWARFLRPELLGVAAGDLLGPNVESATQQVNLALPEGKMAIRHGYRREARKSVYFIELDAYDDRPQEMDLQLTLQQLDLFKRWSWNFFRSSITDELADYLKPRSIT